MKKKKKKEKKRKETKRSTYERLKAGNKDSWVKENSR